MNGTQAPMPGNMSPGEVLDNFQMVEFLGEGKAGFVYKATAQEDGVAYKAGDALALKIYKDWVLEEPAQLSRIERELRSGSSLSHPSLLRIHEARINRLKKFGTYLVMEYLDGVTLLNWISTSHPVTALNESWSYDEPWTNSHYLTTVTLFALQLCHGLHALHTCTPFPILHRDLKPTNVMVLNDSCVKIMDYGVVKLIGVPSLTEDHKFLGTIRNAAPEYLFEERFTVESDLYSLGTVFYAMLSGKEVFHVPESFASLVNRVKTEDIRVEPWVRGRSSYCFLLSLLTESMLEKNPSRRFANIPAIIEVLKRGEQSEWWYNTFAKWLGHVELKELAPSMRALRKLIYASTGDEKRKTIKGLVSQYYRIPPYLDSRRYVYEKIRPVLATMFILERQPKIRSLICNEILGLDGSEAKVAERALWPR